MGSRVNLHSIESLCGVFVGDRDNVGYRYIPFRVSFTKPDNPEMQKLKARGKPKLYTITLRGFADKNEGVWNLISGEILQLQPRTHLLPWKVHHHCRELKVSGGVC